MGEKYLIDTNVVIDFFGASLSLQAHNFISDIDTYISVITQIELFSKKDIPDTEINLFQKYVENTNVFNHIHTDIVNHAINLRREYKLKTPDAIIAATALANNMTLILNS